MNHYTLLLSISLAVCSLQSALADEIMTPVGVVKTPCLPNSDTIVGLPTRQNADYEGSISADPDTTSIAGSAILTLTGDPGLAIDQFAGSHYIKFSNNTPSTAGDGQWFPVSSNEAGSITVDLNGNVIQALAGAKLEVLKFWTLNELFPPSEITTDASTTGNAIVGRDSQAGVAATQIFYPDLISDGIDLTLYKISASSVFFVEDGEWANSAATPNAGDTQLWPDVFFTIRHNASITAATTYTSIGEIEIGDFDIPLRTLNSGQQDNHIAIPRPIDVSLNDLNLGGTTAFVDSLGELSADRKDELRVYDNTQAMINKLPSAIYYHHNGIWKKEGAGSTDVGEDVIPKAAGFIIRKAQTVDGVTHIWKNTPSYPAP